MNLMIAHSNFMKNSANSKGGGIRIHVRQTCGCVLCAKQISI